MGGLKHQRQWYGATPHEPITGASIWERDLAFQAKDFTPYCQFCGREIVNAMQDEHGNKVDPQWEMTYRMHYSCYRMRKLNGPKE